MTVNLVGGAIGVSGSQTQIIDLAVRHGFESVEAKPQDLAPLSSDQLKDVLASMKAKGLVWGASGLPDEAFCFHRCEHILEMLDVAG